MTFLFASQVISIFWTDWLRSQSQPILRTVPVPPVIGKLFIWVPVPSRYWEIVYLNPSPVPLLGNYFFKSQSHPAVEITFFGLPVPSHFREFNFFNPSPIPLMGVKWKQSRSRMTKPDPAEACNGNVYCLGLFNKNCLLSDAYFRLLPFVTKWLQIIIIIFISDEMLGLVS